MRKLLEYLTIGTIGLSSIVSGCSFNRIEQSRFSKLPNIQIDPRHMSKEEIVRLEKKAESQPKEIYDSINENNLTKGERRFWEGFKKLNKEEQKGRLQEIYGDLLKGGRTADNFLNIENPGLKDAVYIYNLEVAILNLQIERGGIDIICP